MEVKAVTSILLCTLYKPSCVLNIFRSHKLSAQLHPSILSCSSNVLCFAANRERRRAAEQLAAQENAIYKDSYLRAFDPARPLHFESWVQRDMQKGFTDELKRLRPGRCQLCGERWFAAQAPTQAVAVTGGQYTCDRCKRQKTVESLSSANDMDPGSVPNQFKGLTQGEEMLIAKGCPVMRVYHLKGGQRGSGGHVVNLAPNIGGFVNSLPRPARDLPTIMVRRQGEEGTHKDLLMRRQRVSVVSLQK